MKSSPFSFLKSFSSGKILLGLSLIVFFFWGLMFLLNDVYEYAIVGVVAEILWIPMILFLVFLPVVSIIRLFLKDAQAKWLSWISLIVGICSILLLVSEK